MTDDELVRSAREALEDVLRIDGAPIFARLFRWPRQTPQYDVGHIDRLAAIEQRMRSIPGAFINIGNGSAEGGCYLHNPHYDFNDAILPFGASYWVRLVETVLPSAGRGG